MCVCISMCFYLKNPHFSPRCKRLDPASLSASLLTCSSSLYSMFQPSQTCLFLNFCQVSGLILCAMPLAFPGGTFHTFLLSQHTYHLVLEVVGIPSCPLCAPCSCPCPASPQHPASLQVHSGEGSKPVNPALSCAHNIWHSLTLGR